MDQFRKSYVWDWTGIHKTSVQCGARWNIKKFTFRLHARFQLSFPEIFLHKIAGKTIPRPKSLCYIIVFLFLKNTFLLNTLKSSYNFFYRRTQYVLNVSWCLHKILLFHFFFHANLISMESRVNINNYTFLHLNKNFNTLL